MTSQTIPRGHHPGPRRGKVLDTEPKLGAPCGFQCQDKSHAPTEVPPPLQIYCTAIPHMVDACVQACVAHDEGNAVLELQKCHCPCSFCTDHAKVLSSESGKATPDVRYSHADSQPYQCHHLHNLAIPPLASLHPITKQFCWVWQIVRCPV
jgi:hypothetical protein